MPTGPLRDFLAHYLEPGGPWWDFLARATALPAPEDLPTGRALRVASWNILDGGPALEEQLALIASYEPDVVFIQEAKGWRANGESKLHTAERLLGMRGYLARAKRHDCNVAIFVHPKSGLSVLRDRHRKGHPYWHAQARIHCECGLTLACSHFAPFSAGIQTEEALASSDLASGRTIYAGDFNGDGLNDPDPDPLLRQPGHKLIRHRDPLTGELDRRAALILAICGFVDVAEYMAQTSGDPRLLAPTAGFKLPSVPRRVDRIYVTRNIGILSYQIVEQYFSDHHLLLADVAV